MVIVNCYNNNDMGSVLIQQENFDKKLLLDSALKGQVARNLWEVFCLKISTVIMAMERGKTFFN